MSASVSNQPTLNHQNAHLEGDFFAPHAAASTKAYLRVANNTVIITDVERGKLLASLPREDLKISDRLGAVARRLSFPDASVFVTFDNDGVDRLVGVSTSSSIVHWMERFHPRMVLLVAATIVMVLMTYWYGMPLVAKAAVTITPNSVVKFISKASLAGFEDRLLKPTKVNPERQARLQVAFDDLVANSTARVKTLEPKLRFHVSPIGPNAFAMPDGTIVITDALLKLIEDEAAIGVLAHEIGHVRYQHGLQLLYRSAGLFVMISLIAGDVGGVMEDLLLQGAGLLTLSYSREFEREADAYSVKLMKQTDRDPLAINEVFRKIEELVAKRRGAVESKPSVLDGWLSTHPLSKERIQNIEKLANED